MYSYFYYLNIFLILLIQFVFIQNLKEVLNNYINKSSTVNDVKQMITLQSDIIVD